MDGISSNGPGRQPKIGSSVSHSARVWNYLLGGKANFEADRIAADLILRVYPDFARLARFQRSFLARAVGFLAGDAGIRQFLDIGTGLSTVNTTHQVAQSVAPECRVVYVDNDPLVLVHARALLTGHPSGATDHIEADVRDPAAILDAAATTLDLRAPVALLLLGVMSILPDSDQPHSIVRRLLDGLAPGSYLALCDGCDTSPVLNEAMRVYNETSAGSCHLRSPARIAAYFDGLEMVPPGVVATPRWHPIPASTAFEPEDVPSLAGVGRKP
jgi:hypothetical protein